MALSVNDLLQQLGLTEYESKALNTLLKLGESEAPQISRMSQVPKTRVYDVLTNLVEKNLVIEIRGRPKKYRGIDANKALDILVELKKQQLQELQEKVGDLKTSLAVSLGPKEQAGETVMRVKDKADFEKILAQEIAKAKNSLVGFAEATDKHKVLREAIEKAKGRNVNVKILNAYSTEWLNKIAHETKQMDHGLNAFIIDGKKVVLALSDFKKDKPEYHFTIFNQHKPIANVLQHYFDACWQQAKK